MLRGRSDALSGVGVVGVIGATLEGGAVGCRSEGERLVGCREEGLTARGMRAGAGARPYSLCGDSYA